MPHLHVFPDLLSQCLCVPPCHAAASSSIGRSSSSNNVIMDTTSDESKWRELDMQVTKR